MGKVIAGMTMSLDGLVNDGSGSIERLYSDFEELTASVAFKEMIENTGAVVMGRKTFEMAEADSYAADYEFQVPVFVVTHSVPEKHPRENENLRFTFVTEGVGRAVELAKEVAGDKVVQVIGGASVVQQCINGGFADEVWIDVMPVVLGEGLRLWENVEVGSLKLEKVGVEELTSARIGMVFKLD